MPTYCVISIGTLAAHPLWDERSAVRTGHATTVLVESADRRIIVNPGLPEAALAARMSERTRVRPEHVTDVFLTGFDADHRRGIEIFGKARWLLHEPERTGARARIESAIERAEGEGDRELVETWRRELDLLRRCADAPDRLAPGVDLFPLPGASPGTCGVLIALPAMTVLCTGDAVATREHLLQTKILPGCADVEAAMESLREVVEIADLVIPGRDNVMVNPARARVG